ncbi:hypothetical protein SCLCIDRAFT_990846 [Scleroderma citrinum Foug A]|uniref:Uncharacterized protein n=1 Tax=Scleroderma citrinum Foug A TaxID=1036808 RepID=A0A0C3A4L9_9AGAM|nr:hypothetical protein SCLCIDRAFT_990846 [Scleroderma citrinum Foug A]
MLLIRPILAAKELRPGITGLFFRCQSEEHLHVRKVKNRLRSILDHGDLRIDTTTFSAADHASQHPANIQKPVMRENVSSKQTLEVDSCM